MNEHHVQVTDEIIDAAEAIKLSSKMVRSLYPKNGKDDSYPLEKLYLLVKSKAKTEITSVQDVMVSAKLYEKLESYVSAYVLKSFKYLTKGSPQHKSSVAINMLNYAPVDIAGSSKIDDLTVYLLDADTRYKMSPKNGS